MEFEQYPTRHDSEPALHKTHALPQENEKVHKTSSEVLPTQLTARNKPPGRARDSLSLHAILSSASQDRSNVGLGILTQGTSDKENDEFIDQLKPHDTALVWDNLNTTDKRSSQQDSTGKQHSGEYEVQGDLVHGSELDKSGESTDLISAPGGTQGLADCVDLVKDEVTESCTLNSDRRDKPGNIAVLTQGEGQGLSDQGSCGNVSEVALTADDKFATAACGNKEKDSLMENWDEEDIVKLSEEVGFEDENKKVSGKKGNRASNVDLCLLLEKEAHNQLRNIKFAIANVMLEVSNSYDAAFGINASRTLMLTQHTSQFLENQEVKKTFYMKDVTSAIAKLSEIFLLEDAHLFRELRDNTQALYDLQTRKLYFEQKSSEATAAVQDGETKSFVCFLAVVAVGLALGFNGEWIALLLLVLMILFCIFLAWRGMKSVHKKKRKLRGKIL